MRTNPLSTAIVGIICLLSIALGVLGTDKAQTPGQTLTGAGQLTLQPIHFAPADGQGENAEMGRLAVPERHRIRNGKVIEIAFVRLKSTSERPGAPIIYLAGGPGGSGIDSTNALPVLLALRALADVILLDQRGTGRSLPSTMCRESFDLPLDRPGDPRESIAILKEQSRKCAHSLTERGIDLSAYNTEESADDIEDLRSALGASKVTLYGHSYGTHLAISALRRHEKSIDRVILAGVEGPDDTLKLPGNVQRQFEEIARLVKVDPEVGKAVPDFMGLMRAVLRQLGRQPVTVSEFDPQTRQMTKIVIGRFDLQLLTANAIGDSAAIKALPAFYFELAHGDWSQLARQAMSLRRRPLGNAMAYAMDCASSASVRQLTRIKQEEKRTLLGSVINLPFPDICEAWGVARLGEDFRRPLRSKVPVLIISGTIDGRTPVSNGQAMQRGLSRSVELVIEGASHDGLFTSSPKITEVVSEFVTTGRISTTRIKLPPIAFLPVDRPAARNGEIVHDYIRGAITQVRALIN
ncbi:MAG TPA: alpha/beta hydrolase [Pyrinomonadaceae bacterium]|nr:alpha/beta hydrolase [Pyrinomonadaceae bacterium]